MTQLMEILKISVEEQLLIKHWVIKHLILLNITKNTNLIKRNRHWYIKIDFLKVDLASLISKAHKLDIDKLEKVPTGLKSLKPKVDKLDVDKLVPVPIDLSKLTNVVKNYVVKRTVYDELIEKFNAIQTTDTSKFV